MAEINETGFMRGYAAACAFIARDSREPSMAKDALKEHFQGVSDLKKYSIDNYDADTIRPLLREIESNMKKCKPASSSKSNECTAEIKLEQGRQYENRRGEVVKIVSKVSPFEHGISYRGDDTMLYRHDGRFLPDGSPTSYDLVREVNH